jgi:hypothetical protein
MEDESNSAETEIKSDPTTMERVRVHKKFEKSMDEKGLLDDDHSVRLEPEEIRHEEPPGTEQSAG